MAMPPEMEEPAGFEGTPPDAEVGSMDLETAIQVLEHFGITPEDVAVVVVALETVLNAGGGSSMGGSEGQPMAPAPVAPKPMPAPAAAMPPSMDAQAGPAPANAARPAPAPRPAMAPAPEMTPPRQAAPRAPTGNPLVDIVPPPPPQPMQPLPLNQRGRKQAAY